MPALHGIGLQAPMSETFVVAGGHTHTPRTPTLSAGQEEVHADPLHAKPAGHAAYTASLVDVHWLTRSLPTPGAVHVVHTVSECRVQGAEAYDTPASHCLQDPSTASAACVQGDITNVAPRVAWLQFAHAQAGR